MLKGRASRSRSGGRLTVSTVIEVKDRTRRKGFIGGQFSLLYRPKVLRIIRAIINIFWLLKLIKSPLL